MFKKIGATLHCWRLVRPLLVAALGAVCAPALAGGIILYEVGSADVGLAYGGGTEHTNTYGATYYLNGNTRFQPAFGANGVYCTVVAAP